MAGIERFEDIEGWKKARELTRAIYSLTSTGEFSRDYGLKDQLRRASVSIMSNIAEGFERGGDKEFQQFLAIAKGSTGEVKAQLYIALDARYIDREAFQSLYEMANETGRIIAGFMRYLANSPRPTNKFK
ncbi:MAG: four helix bundle protein [Armatimonadetes bacterium]|nr:four helix bundle protein [Armatimonadota bacterium]